MNRAAFAAAMAGVALLATSCSSEPTYGESVKRCVAAIKSRPDGDKAKPEPCEPLKEDDDTTLIMDKTLGDLGWLDKDGNLDKDALNRNP
ncbi:hypothetical protein [Streptomyces sp. NPDC056387]|uniref:hypothetical protein n=1 Tax=Streptomyces sp. NPDC056387 TaxID=3345803 RepID=UPI0035DD5FBB